MLSLWHQSSEESFQDCLLKKLCMALNITQMNMYIGTNFDNHLIINLYELLKDSSDPKDYPNPKNNYLSGKVNTNLHNLVQVY